ncbi:Plant peroxidase [Corchorus capsularis]|uniref:peroxidase n=1 Tax=Corchorus capsularis TaxID=210143 RepID=A0A1R3IU76_COCAP|nr:Plant peroxidase [Corchorus capsularis]
MGEVNFLQEEDIRLENTRARFANVVKRHAQLTERLSRDSDKTIYERLQKEFEAARASQSQEVNLDGEQWNDGLLATLREQVHMEADRKARSGETNNNMPTSHFEERITYRVGNKVICCLEGTRIGILYETSFAGDPCDLYHCVLESKSFLEKMTVLEHTVPFFLPIREAENELLSSNAMRFIDHIGELLQAYVDRREQVRLIKELYGNQIGELYHSLPYHMIEFVLDDSDCKVTISLRYADLVSVLPTRVKVLAWPMHQLKKNHTSSAILNRNENGTMNSHPIPARLSYAEDALRTMSLPEGIAFTVGYYQNSCPDVESIVNSAVKQKFQQTFVTAPATLRLFFHDCFVRGCDASVMLSSWNNTAEKDNPDNLSLAGDGFDTVIKAKAAVDSVPECRNKVSCADILAMATRDVITLTGGPFYAVELGRLDGRMSTKASVRHHLPGPDFKLGKLKAMFASHGLTLTDLVALSGAHTIGFSHCSRFARRIYKFKSKTGIDPTLDQAYARQLRQMCPENVDPRMAIEMDSATPRTFDNLYYKNLQQGKGLFTSDQSLFTDDAMSRNIVNVFASNNTAFEEAFVIAITKLGRLRVRKGKQGEIRHDCAVVNKI